jgi:hypothetical protein
MKYKLNFSPKANVSVPSVTGAVVGATAPAFFAWQPSTWPATPPVVDDAFIYALKQIFEESILGEINNVIRDVHKSNGDLQNRGHVLAISIMCTLDAIASYRHRKHHFADFIVAHFPADYHAHAVQIFALYRNSLIRSWNLFEASIYPDDSRVRMEGGTLAFGLLNFFGALVQGTGEFLERLAADPVLQKNTLARYDELKLTAKP